MSSVILKAAKKHAVRTAASNTFELVARDWHAAQVHRWSELYAEQVLKRFETEVFPDLGHRPISAIEPTEMLATLKKVEQRGVIETTRRLRSCCSSVFRFANASGYSRYDAAGHLGPALKPMPKAE
jgi:integrase